MLLDNWGDKRDCDKGHWHTHTRGVPWGLPEVVGTVQVHWSRRKLLQRGLEFHVCTMDESVHTKKMSENLFNDPHILSLGHKFLCIVRNFLVIWSICLSSFLDPFKNGPEYHTSRDSQGVYFFDKISSAEIGFKKFSCSFEVLFGCFLVHLCLFDGVYYWYSQVLVIFLLSKSSDALLI